MEKAKASSGPSLAFQKARVLSRHLRGVKSKFQTLVSISGSPSDLSALSGQLKRVESGVKSSVENRLLPSVARLFERAAELAEKFSSDFVLFLGVAVSDKQNEQLYLAGMESPVELPLSVLTRTSFDVSRLDEIEKAEMQTIRILYLSRERIALCELNPDDSFAVLKDSPVEAPRREKVNTSKRKVENFQAEVLEWGQGFAELVDKIVGEFGLKRDCGLYVAAVPAFFKAAFTKQLEKDLEKTYRGHIEAGVGGKVLSDCVEKVVKLLKREDVERQTRFVDAFKKSQQRGVYGVAETLEALMAKTLGVIALNSTSQVIVALLPGESGELVLAKPNDFYNGKLQREKKNVEFVARRFLAELAIEVLDSSHPSPPLVLGTASEAPLANHCSGYGDVSGILRFDPREEEEPDPETHRDLLSKLI